MPQTENVILTNMCLISDGTKVLVQNRRDVSWQGLAYPGGKVEKGESLHDSVCREVYEETGLTVSEIELCGIKQFTAEDSSYRYLVFLYKANRFEGRLHSSDEGPVFWLERSELCNYPLADGFEAMLPIFENDNLSELYYYSNDGYWQFKHL